MSDPKELGDLAAVVIAADRTADIPALRAIIAAGYMSPGEHADVIEDLHETLDDYCAAARENDALKAKVARVEALEKKWRDGDQYDQDAAVYLREVLAEPDPT